MFGKKRSAKSGIHPWCRPCNVEAARLKTPEAKAKKASYDRRYVAENRDRIQLREQDSYARKRSVRIAQVADWAKRNPAARRAIIRNYKARRRSQTEGGCTAAQLREWLEIQTFTCVWCAADCSDDYHVDHVVPLARGGEHALYNLAIACPVCNQRKSVKDPMRFALELQHERAVRSFLIGVALAA
ncbi:HNH endonuclease [Novosphingobium resinovorum]|uniref:HNH endonuclease n=1 Tax=Novosphingobium resinovorum TaxID=158500 RepID=UPI0009F26EDD